MPPGRRDDDDEDIPTLDDPFTTDLDLDLDDEAEDEDEDDDIVVPELPHDDMPPMEDGAEPEGSDIPELDDWFEDEDTDVWRIIREDQRQPEPEDPGERVVLPWRTRAEIPALDMEIPAILDPTRATTVWTVAAPPTQERVEILVRLPGVEVRVEATLEVGDTPGLILGRDALSGKVLVES